MEDEPSRGELLFELRALRKSVDKLATDINGNGRQGIADRLLIVETRLEGNDSSFSRWFGVLSFVVGALLTAGVILVSI